MLSQKGSLIWFPLADFSQPVCVRSPACPPAMVEPGCSLSVLAIMMAAQISKPIAQPRNHSLRLPLASHFPHLHDSGWVVAPGRWFLQDAPSGLPACRCHYRQLLPPVPFFQQHLVPHSKSLSLLPPRVVSLSHAEALTDPPGFWMVSWKVKKALQFSHQGPECFSSVRTQDTLNRGQT